MQVLCRLCWAQLWIGDPSKFFVATVTTHPLTQKDSSVGASIYHITISSFLAAPHRMVKIKMPLIVASLAPTPFIAPAHDPDWLTCGSQQLIATNSFVLGESSTNQRSPLIPQ